MSIHDLQFVRGAYVPRITASTPVAPKFTPLINCDASKIAGANVTNTGRSDGKVLSYDGDTGTMAWITPTTGLVSRTLTISNSGETLGVEPSIYYVVLPYYPSFSVTLPDAVDMTDRELTFITTTPSYESFFTIHGGTINNSDDATYTMGGIHFVKLLCDGEKWWITGESS